MVRGRSTIKIGVRIADDLYYRLKSRADSKGSSFSDYLRECLEYIDHHSGDKLLPLQTMTPKEVLKQAEINARVKKPYDPNTMNRTMDLPIYDAGLHKKGDKVRIFKFGRWKAYTVPEIDSEGNITGG